MVLSLVAKVLTFIIEVIVPLYRSLKALRKTDSHELTDACKFWVIYGIFFVFEGFLGTYLEDYIPYYVHFRLLLYAALVLNRFGLAVFLYDKVFSTQFLKHEDSIDNRIEIINDNLGKLREQAKGYVYNSAVDALYTGVQKILLSETELGKKKEPENAASESKKQS
mmetsp:Transcript_53453/g.61270  ORF Transcript_53453/g.61270 Transcript_53453/m.61270 type:complete len:166 (+) Transcript_53453:255-752(+)